MQADVPESQIARLVYVAHFRERGEQAMRGGRGQVHAQRQVGELQAAVCLGERVEDRQTPCQALYLAGRRAGLGRGAAAAGWGGETIGHGRLGSARSSLGELEMCGHPT